MSTNIKIQKICEFCGQEFTARTLVTRFCSHKCNSRHYKQVTREGKRQALEKTQIVAENPLHVLRNASQEYFEVSEAATIMRISRRTLYRLISLKKIKKKENALEDSDP
ncbi:MAG TPA: DNA-binding protein [Cyclobacteriaceae bacterium]|nr:DNA-binding protein [Cyclobacteriaceae bacterium]